MGMGRDKHSVPILHFPTLLYSLSDSCADSNFFFKVQNGRLNELEEFFLGKR